VDIKLNFINNSNDANNSQIVIFQKNVATTSEEAVAWRVIQNCGPGERHPFVYPMKAAVSASDSYGNYSPLLDAQPGQAFAVAFTDAGDTLRPAGSARSPAEIQVSNALPKGAISASVYKDGAAIATRTSIAPGQAAAFAFRPTLWIGAVSQVEQGQVMDSAIAQSANTEISLLGIASADIVMTGGGSGPEAKPFQFTLQNVIMA
jgi:hypothetical protein